MIWPVFDVGVGWGIQAKASAELKTNNATGRTRSDKFSAEL
tara:strand:+ start:747 stop:869 length:123 start_codon:yes stop_codon:yes gene_type:complete